MDLIKLIKNKFAKVSLARIITFCVVLMIVIGGVTRITGSGLSMVEWRPLIGWLPPFSEKEWTRIFVLYQRSPQFVLVNAWMDLEAFKDITFSGFKKRDVTNMVKSACSHRSFSSVQELIQECLSNKTI